MKKVHPRDADALNRLGTLAAQAGNLERAVALFEQATQADPKKAAGFNNRGLALQGLGRWEAALESYEAAIARDAGHAVAYFNRGNVQRLMGRLEASLASYDRAVALRNGFTEAHYNRGILLHELGRLDAALDAYDAALATAAGHADAWFNRGNVLRDLLRWRDALASYDRAIAIRSRFPEAHLNRGDVLYALKELQPALQSYDRAIAERAHYAKAYFNRGHIFRDSKQPEAALASYRRAFALEPTLEFLSGALLLAQLQVCDWDGIDAGVAALETRLERDEPAAFPFALLALSGSAGLQRRAAQIWVRERYPPQVSLPVIAKYDRHERMRIGYFSADFHAHATAYLIAGVLEAHDRSRCHVTAFSFGPESDDAMRRRLVDACDDFIDVRRQSDAEVARLARDLHIDIAVDLKGFTRDSRPGIFARRAAAVQISYLGYPGTLGADYMDYLIADRTLVPDERLGGYAEKIVFLPDSYQPNDGRRAISDRRFSRAELGLPPAGFVFCCFNNSFKILPDTFDRWMRILHRVPGSVLWLLADNPAAVDNLRRAAALRHVDADRLVFGERMGLPDHLARHAAADLFIDTWPCNAHTTASDALWAGLPLITFPGETFASRVAASLLTALGMPELIAATAQDYEELAVHLATDPPRLAHLRRKLADRRLNSPLFDTALYTKRLEAAYAAIYERCQADLPPDHILG